MGDLLPIAVSCAGAALGAFSTIISWVFTSTVKRLEEANHKLQGRTERIADRLHEIELRMTEHGTRSLNEVERLSEVKAEVSEMRSELRDLSSHVVAIGQTLNAIAAKTSVASIPIRPLGGRQER